MSLTVVKVGGSLLAGAADLRRVVSAIAEKRRDGGPLLVVASAVQGVTDLLDLAARQAVARGRNGHPGATLDELRRRHLEIARDAADAGEGTAVADRLEAEIGRVEALLGAIRTAGELADATYVRLLSHGERLSVLLLAAALQAAGHAARPVTAEEAGLRAAGPPRHGSCDFPASAAGFRWLRRHLGDRILVLTGFYGVDGAGGVVLFGRGGSDDTACAAAAGLDAGRLELWKDVPGLMSADPRDVRGARVIREVSFDEIAQLGAYGSRVVHPGCLEPLRGRATRVLLSSLPGDGATCGTLLVERLQRDSPRVVALASRRGDGERSPAQVGVVGEGVVGAPEIRTRMLSCLAAAGARSDMVARPSGRSGLSCTVHPDDLIPALSSLHESFFAAPEGARA